MKRLFLSLLVFEFFSLINAQDTKLKEGFNITADIVSSYIWRGLDQEASKGGSPNIQPTIAYVTGRSTTSVWGSTSFAGGLKEIDFSETILLSEAFSITLTDDNWFFDKNYFNYSNSQTDHIFEGTVTYTGKKPFPLAVSINTMFYGNDKDKNGNNAYSTYVELNYPICSNTNAFCGMSLFDSPHVYGNKGFSVINLGLKVSKEVKVNDAIMIPFYGVIGCNPQAGKAFFVAGVTL
jgi:hypothetical protein